MAAAAQTQPPGARALLRRVLVTGARGSIGRALSERLNPADSMVEVTDLGDMDVRDRAKVQKVFAAFRPTLVYHLAGAKSAPDGENDPWNVCARNVDGTRNVLRSALSVGAKVVTASTCKAADPETVYGASKLLCERLTLHAGGWVARFYNVRESSGNVFETWRAIPAPEPIPVANCWRYFISMADAVRLLVAVPSLPPGRYTVFPGHRRNMWDEAIAAYPDRELVAMDCRRGDRLREPRHADCEHMEPVEPGMRPICRIVSPHDA